MLSNVSRAFNRRLLANANVVRCPPVSRNVVGYHETFMQVFNVPIPFL
jgi:hypothetical protein